MILIGKERAILYVVYASIGLGIALAARHGALKASAAFALLTTLWLGFVLAISFTEAWIKFRAPFLPRHFGLDVGRTVFLALQAIECGLCLSLWLVSWLVPTADAVPGRLSTLLWTTIILLLQVVWFYPRLELRGEYAIYAALKSVPETDLTPTQRQVFADVANNVNTTSEPAVWFHIVYVVAECLQVAALARFAWLCLTV